MKFTTALLALVTLAFPVSLRADTISATVTTSGGTQTITGTPILNGEVFDYTHLNTALFDGNIGVGSGSFHFSKPQEPSSDGPVPEPRSLCLMATGLLGAAGVIRRKFSNT
ncbi:MAG: PEP-CTERM sorting domain-containing protein [Edaphobacter sp.]